MDHLLHIVSPGERPPYYQVACHLWGQGCDIDSDGDSSTPESKLWTELTLVLRSDQTQRVDIDPLMLDPLVLVVRSTHESLCKRVAEYVTSKSGGEIRRLNHQADAFGAAKFKR